jgi:hypothetical protein
MRRDTPNATRSGHERQRNWIIAALIVAPVAAIASLSLVRYAYAYPDQPESPGWLAVYGENIGQEDGRLAVVPFPTPTFKGTLRAVQDGSRVHARFSVSAPNSKFERPDKADRGRAARVMIVAGGGALASPVSFRLPPATAWAAPMGVPRPLKPAQSRELLLLPQPKDLENRNAAPPPLRAVTCTLENAEQVCAVDLSWPVSATETSTFQRRAFRLPTVQPRSLPGLKNWQDSEWSVYPVLLAQDRLPIPLSTSQIVITASLVSQENLFRVRVDTGFPAVAASSGGLVWAAESAAPNSPVEPQVLLADPGKERWAQAALVAAGALAGLAATLVWEAIRSRFG